MKHVYTFCRGFAALMVIQYGFAKINGAQFTVLDSVLDKPLEEVSGFWLTWYYFGYSQAYGTIIALLQIVGGGLLLFRRTTLLGACLLFGMMANIILVDIFFGIPGSALGMAIVIEACLGFIVFQHREELLDLFVRRSPDDRGNAAPAVIKWAARGAILVLPALSTYWIANYNNRHPTSIDGTWLVESVENPAPLLDTPDRIYFEYNRAFMTVFAYSDSSTTHHFRVDEEAGSITIWQRWLARGPEVFSGEFDLEGDRMTLRGSFSPDSAQVRLHLLRIRRK